LFFSLFFAIFIFAILIASASRVLLQPIATRIVQLFQSSHFDLTPILGRNVAFVPITASCLCTVFVVLKVGLMNCNKTTLQPKFGVILLLITLPLLGVIAPARAEMQSGSSLNLASVDTTQSAKLKVSIALESSEEMVFQSGSSLRVLPTSPSIANQQSALLLDFGVGRNWQDQRINVVGASASLQRAYADRDTIVQDVSLDGSGKFRGAQMFLQNIWIKGKNGDRQSANFILRSFDFNAKTGIGKIAGAFVDATGAESPATGSFSAFYGDDCISAYSIQLEVAALPDAPKPLTELPSNPAPGTPSISGGGGGGGMSPAWLAVGAPFFWLGGGGGSSSDTIVPPPETIAPPSVISPPIPMPPLLPPPTTPQPPEQSVPTPALLPGLIGLMWKMRRQKANA
jgi:hypothetical protein